MSIVLGMIAHDIKSDMKGSAQYISITMFYVLAITLFPLAIGPETNMLRLMAPGLLVVCAVLSSLMAQERMFKEDLRDGTLEMLTFSNCPYALIIFAKIIAHWILTGLPASIIAPVLALMLDTSIEQALIAAPVIATLCLILSLLGAMLAALSLKARKGTVLLALVALPLYIPMLIFSTSILDMSATVGINNAIAPSLFLLSILAVLLPMSPIVSSILVKWTIEE